MWLVIYIRKRKCEVIIPDHHWYTTRSLRGDVGCCPKDWPKNRPCALCKYNEIIKFELLEETDVFLLLETISQRQIRPNKVEWLSHKYLLWNIAIHGFMASWLPCMASWLPCKVLFYRLLLLLPYLTPTWITPIITPSSLMKEAVNQTLVQGFDTVQGSPWFFRCTFLVFIRFPCLFHHSL